MKFRKVLASIAAATLAGGVANAQLVVGPDGAGGFNAYQNVGGAVAWDVAWDNAKNTTFPGVSIGGVPVLPASDLAAHLVTIPNAEVNSFVNNTLGTGWIGLTDNDIPDELFDLGAFEAGNTGTLPLPAAGQVPGPGERGEGFIWVDGSPLVYSNWNGSEPNDSSGEDAIEMIGGGLWNDLRVGDTFGDQASAGHERGPIIEWDLGLTELPVEMIVDVTRDDGSGQLMGRIAARVTDSGASPGSEISTIDYQIYEQLTLPLLSASEGPVDGGLLTEVYFRGNTGSAQFLRDNPLPAESGVWSPGGGFAGIVQLDGLPSWANDGTGTPGSGTAPPYPQELVDLGFPAGGNQENYSTRSTGEIFLSAGTDYRFRDGVDDYTLLQIDLNGNGDYEDDGETLIDDNSWTGWSGMRGGNTTGPDETGGISPGDEAVVNVAEDGWYPIRFGTAEGGGGDPHRLMWNIDNGNSPDPAQTVDDLAGNVDTFYTIDAGVVRHNVPEVLVSALVPLGASTDLGPVGLFGDEAVGTFDEAAVIPVNGAGGIANFFNDGEEHTLVIEAQLGQLMSARQEVVLAAQGGGGGGGCDGPLAALGDINCDDSVDLADFNILKANFNTSADAAVPEPSTLALLGLGGLAALAVARRRK